MKKLAILLLVLPIISMAQTNYKKIDGYKLLSKITPPDGYNISPGQFSKDYKKYYLPVFDVNQGPSVYIYQMEGKGKTTLLSKHKIEIPEGKEFSGQVSLTEDEKTIVFVVTNDNSWTNNELCIAELENKNKSYVKTRILGELNEEKSADAYPVISADGLRIYWVQNEKYFVSSRKERNHAFRGKTELKVFSKSISSAWISPDELNIFIVSSGSVYLSERKTTSSDFTSAVLHSSSFTETGFIAGYNETKSKLAAVYISLNDEEESEFIAIYKKK